MDYKQSVNYSGFWVRFLAYVIDSFILGFVYGLITIVQVVLSIIMGEGSVLGIAVIAILIYLAVGLAYMVLMPASKYQGTFGKKIMGIKIINEDGERISVGSSVLRYLGMMVSGLIIYIGYIMIAFHPQKRALHDIIGKTYVVSAK